MPHIPRTPESLLSRADSKNPLTTCRGLTSNGRPCRRALAAASSNPSSPLSTSSKSRSPAIPGHIVNGVITVAHTEGSNHGVTAAFFCWQHRDQAASTLHVKKEDVVELHNRSSLDTLVERFGVLDVADEQIVQKVQKARTRHHRTDERQQPAHTAHEKARQRAPQQHERASPPAPRPSIWSIFCCFSPSSLDYDDHDEPEYHPSQRPSSYARQPEMTTKRPSYDYHSHNVTRPPPSASSWPPQRTKATPPSPQRAHPRPSPSLDFSNPASLIPIDLPPSTQSQLLAQLTKPLSIADEAGYIYVFQLDATSSPGASPTKPASPSSADANNLLIKIGRTNNVRRRLSSWTRQCGHDLSLLRFYPYVSASPTSPSTPTPPSPSTPRTLPYSHRVERLIHIELGAQRVKQEKCGKCGKEHREWFEIEATREGIRRMDEVVRKWVAWGEWMGERE